MGIKRKLLVGGDLKWNVDDWTASDDRVRGGKSESHLTPHAPTNSTAHFHGHLDIRALGGAGFASQYTTSTSCWNLSPYDGINVSLNKTKSDDKTYTFILKDEVPETYFDAGRERERERASVNWECDFRVVGSDGSEEEEWTKEEEEEEEERGKEKEVFIPWKEFKPTYRGREVKDPKKRIDLTRVRRLSLMIRSFFGSQEGDFSLTIRSIGVVTVEKKRKQNGDGDGDGEGEGKGSASTVADDSGSGDSEPRKDGERESRSEKPAKQGWLQWLVGQCGKL